MSRPSQRAARDAQSDAGVVFTPEEWAAYAARTSGILRDWLDGASVCDPTAGKGAFVFALCDEAARRGRFSTELCRRVFICEKNEDFLRSFFAAFEARYGRPFPQENAHCGDILTDPPSVQVDCLIGNPPWANFCDLSDSYKRTLKPYFIGTRLVDSTQSLLLGSSRIDLAALIVVWTIARFLRPKGKAAFFLPLSIFQNQGAHQAFRRYVLPDGSPYALREIIDFNGKKIFDGVTTRFGIARFERDAVTDYPVVYSLHDGESQTEKRATPVPETCSPLMVHEPGDAPLESIEEAKILLRPDQTPRQGVNTCGANDVLVFDEVPDFLPKSLLFPLITKETFRSPDRLKPPRRFIFLPYDRAEGRPLSQDTLERRFPAAWEYLVRCKDKLCARKGTLIRSWCKRGYFWALLGVGPYSFAPYKVVWEAYGARHFRPMIVSSWGGKPWQANQAMHALIPCNSLEEAESVLFSLRRPAVERFLQSSRTAGTCNWAQPGRIKQLIAR